MRSIETFKNDILRAAVPAVGALAITGCIENAPHPSYAQAQAAICESPPTFSPLYEGSENVATDHSNWKWVVAYLDETPEGVGYRATYGASEQQQGGKRGFVSPNQNAQEKGLGFSIGRGDVMFGVTVVASLGSAACDVAPKVRFSEAMPTEPKGVVKPPL